jgi:hypothetical protein
MMSFDTVPTQVYFPVTKSEIEDFSHSEMPLHLGSKTLELASVPEYREPGIIIGGRFSARCEMTEEDSSRAFSADVTATLPSAIHSWLKARTYGRNENTEPTGYIAWEAPVPGNLLVS